MNRSRSIPSTVIGLMLVTGLVTSAGCAMPTASDFKPSNLFSLESGWPFRDESEPRKGVPVRVVGTWIDTVMHQAGQTPQRGFGGRLMFYGRDEKTPILVDGQLVVYAFDETNREPTDNKPTRRYVFPADQMPLHMSKNEIGASYSFWLPWDEAGGPKTEVSLMCRFEPKGGSVITSEQTKLVLEGTMRASSVATREPPRLPEGVPVRPALPTLESLQRARQADRAVQLANYETPVEPSSSAPQAAAGSAAVETGPRMSVTSITLPKDYHPQANPRGLPQRVARAAATSPPPATNAASPAGHPATQPQTAVNGGRLPLIRPQLMSPQGISWQTPTPELPAPTKERP